jgi:hypothetical protein
MILLNVEGAMRMPQDRNGKDLHVGNVVACKFRITNTVSDSEKMNLLVKHFDGNEGIPDDWRLQLASSSVVLISEERPPVNPKPQM